MALTDSQLQDAIIELFQIIGVSRLPSELQGLSAIPDKEHFLHLQKGEADGQRVNLEQVRGFFGPYDPIANNPELSNVTGTEGTYFIVSSAGSRDFGNGVVELAEGDILEFKGGKWKVAEVSEAVASSTQTITLGEIGPSTPIEEAFNDFHFENPTSIQPLSKGLTLVKATRDSIPTSWLFVGDSGVYDEVNTTDNLDFFTISGSGGSVVQESDINGNIQVNGTEVVVYDDSVLSGRVTTAETKLNGIEPGATADQTGSEIISAIDATLGNTDWKTQKTLEQIQDIVGAMFQAGTHTNISVTYDDAAGTLNLTGSSGGTGTSEEDIEDIVAGFALQGTGVNIVYDDLNNTLRFSLSGESFTTAYKNKLDGIEANANNYIHPASHPATMITEDATHRFATDTEKAAWNAKQDALGFTPANDAEVVKGVLTSAGAEIPKDVNGKVTLPAAATGGEIVSAIDAELGSTEWKTQKTLEQIQDILGAMLQAGTHTNITVEYDDVNGTLNLTGATAGSSTSEEDIEDIVAGFALQGTGVNIVYDDVANTLRFSLSGESFTTAYKNKLDGIEANANNYLHPASHPPSIIVQDSNNRFVTDTEKATWNAKQNAIGYTPANDANVVKSVGYNGGAAYLPNASGKVDLILPFEKKRTIKAVPNTSQYTLIAADFTDFILDFTANAGESISVILNTGVAPAGGQIQAISSGNNFLVPTAGTGITLLRPEGTNLKTTAKGWIGLIPLSASNTFGVNGNLESTEGGGETYTVFTATEDGLVPTPNEVGTTKFLRQDGAWVVPDGASYSVFTNTADGLVPAPNVSGSGYSVTITSPTEGQTFTEGETISLTSQITTIAAAKKVLKSTGWEFETADEVVTIFDADLVSGEYFLTQNDHRKVLWFNTTAAVVTIAFDTYTLSDDFEFHGIAPANGDNLDFRAYGPNYNSTQVSEGNLPIIISKGVFKGKKITGNTLNISGDTIKEYDIFQSPNGTKYKVSVSDAGALTVTAL